MNSPKLTPEQYAHQILSGHQTMLNPEVIKRSEYRAALNKLLSERTARTQNVGQPGSGRASISQKDTVPADEYVSPHRSRFTDNPRTHNLTSGHDVLRKVERYPVLSDVIDYFPKLGREVFCELLSRRSTLSERLWALGGLLLLLLMIRIALFIILQLAEGYIYAFFAFVKLESDLLNFVF